MGAQGINSGTDSGVFHITGGALCSGPATTPAAAPRRESHSHGRRKAADSSRSPAAPPTRRAAVWMIGPAGHAVGMAMHGDCKIRDWTLGEALDSEVNDLVVVADAGIHFQQQATHLCR